MEIYLSGLPGATTCVEEWAFSGNPCTCLTLLPTGVAWNKHYCLFRWSLTPPFHPYQ